MVGQEDVRYTMWVRRMSCDGFGGGGLGGCHVMDLEVVGQEDGFGGGGIGGCRVMDLGWVRRMSCDGFGVVCVM